MEDRGSEVRPEERLSDHEFPRQTTVERARHRRREEPLVPKVLEPLDAESKGMAHLRKRATAYVECGNESTEKLAFLRALRTGRIGAHILTDEQTIEDGILLMLYGLHLTQIIPDSSGTELAYLSKTSMNMLQRIMGEEPPVEACKVLSFLTAGGEHSAAMKKAARSMARKIASEVRPKGTLTAETLHFLKKIARTALNAEERVLIESLIDYGGQEEQR